MSKPDQQALRDAILALRSIAQRDEVSPSTRSRIAQIAVGIDTALTYAEKKKKTRTCATILR